MTTLLDLIVATRRDDPLGAVENAVFGTTDPEHLADECTRWCRSCLGSSPRAAWMFAVQRLASVGFPARHPSQALTWLFTDVATLPNTRQHGQN